MAANQNMLLPLVQDILIVIAILFLGSLFTRLFLGYGQSTAMISLAFPIGGGLLTWFIFMASWLGRAQDMKATMFVVIVFLLIILSFWGRRPMWAQLMSLKNQIRDWRSQTRLRSWQLAIWSILGVIIIAAFIISVGRSYAGWDAVAFWSLKGYGMALDNSFQAYGHWGDHGVSYPPNIPLLVSMFGMVNGDVLPGSKILFPLYFVSLLIGAFRFWRRTGVGAIPSMVGMLFLASVPIIFEFATIGYANLPIACFLALAVLWGAEGIFLKEPKAQLLSGILFGLAAWTRPEGILFGLIGIAVLLFSSRLMKRGRISISSFLFPIILIGGSWLIFYSLNGGGDSQAMGGVKAAINSIKSGDFQFIAIIGIAKFALRNAIEIKTWGLLFPCSLISLVIAVRSVKSGFDPFFWSCFLAAVAFGVFTLLMFYIGQFDTGPEFLQGWLGRGFARALLPAGVLFAVMCVNSLGKINYKLAAD